jgi:lysophospholipase L1-like esterase
MSSIARAMAKLVATPATFKMVMLGDSTSDFAIMTDLASRLRTYHTSVGRVLYGVASNNIINGGSNGAGLNHFLAVGGGGCAYPYSQLLTDAPDLIVFSFGINDVRTGAFDQAGLTAEMVTAITNIQRDLPNADIVLRIPNSFLTVDDGAHRVTPNSSAQAYTSAVRGAYLSFLGVYPHIVVYDFQNSPFGVTCQATSPLMADQLHPSTVGQNAVADYVCKLFQWTIKPPSTGLDY